MSENPNDVIREVGIGLAHALGQVADRRGIPRDELAAALMSVGTGLTAPLTSNLALLTLIEIAQRLGSDPGTRPLQ
jgi:hypothetical protein